MPGFTGDRTYLLIGYDGRLVTMDTNNGAIIGSEEYGNGVRFDSVDVQLSTNPARMYWVDTLGGNMYAKDLDGTRRRKRAAEDDVLVSAVLHR